MRYRHLVMILVLAWMTTPGPRRDAPAAEGNIPAEAKETGADEVDIGYVPTSQSVVNVMLALAEVDENDLLYDLGCGDGRFVVTASKNYGCKSVGVDIDPARVRESLANVKEAGLEDMVTIEQKNIFELDLSEVDVVMLYLLPELNVKLIPQLEKMKPGSRIVSHDFDMPGVEPDAVVTVSGRQRGERKFYLWTVPLNKVASTGEESEGGDQGRRLGPLVNALAQVPYAVPILVAILAAVFAAVLWCLRKRLGMIRISVKRDRPQGPRERLEERP